LLLLLVVVYLMAPTTKAKLDSFATNDHPQLLALIANQFT
jgi:hypothetical protein